MRLLIPGSGIADMKAASVSRSNVLPDVLRTLWADKLATVSAIFLAIVLICALIGPTLLAEQAAR